MSILLVEDLSLTDCTDFKISTYEKIYIILNKINREVIDYLLELKLQNNITCLINNDNIIKSPDSYLIIRNFKFLVFNFKLAINSSNLNNNILQSKYFLKNINHIKLDSNYNVYSNLLKYIITNHNKDCNNIDILNCNKIHKSLIDIASNNNIIVKALNNELLDITYNNTNFDLKFIHITKNAGTYIEDLGFKSNLVLGKIKNSIDKYNLTHNQNVDYYHLTPSLFYNEVFNNNYCNSNNVNFLVVRNPYDRILSELYCPWIGIVKNNTTPSKEEINKFLNYNLKRFLKNPDSLLKGGHYGLQYSYVYDKNDILIVDEILKLETLDEDLEKLNKKYNLNLVIDKKKTNTSSKNCKISDISDENIELINTIYKLDFEKFEYPMINRNLKDLL